MIRITSRGSELKAQLNDAGLEHIADKFDDSLSIIKQIDIINNLSDEDKIAIIKGIRLHTPLLISLISTMDDKRLICDDPPNKRVGYVCNKLKG